MRTLSSSSSSRLRGETTEREEEQRSGLGLRLGLGLLRNLRSEFLRLLRWEERSWRAKGRRRRGEGEGEGDGRGWRILMEEEMNWTSEFGCGGGRGEGGDMAGINRRNDGCEGFFL